MANVTAAQAMNTARDENPTFDKNRHTDRVLMRFLTRYQQRLLTQIAQIRKDAIVETYEIDVPVFDYEDGETLPGHILIHGGTVFYKNTGTDPDPLNIVGFDQRLNEYRWPTAYLDRTTLYLTGKRADWTDIREIELRYFPRGAEVTDPDAPLDLPGQALDACAAALALFMARRSTKEIQASIDVAGLASEAGAAETRYLDEITGRKQVTVLYPTEQW